MSAHPQDLNRTQPVEPIPVHVAGPALCGVVDLLYSSPKFECDDVVGTRGGP